MSFVWPMVLCLTESIHQYQVIIARYFSNPSQRAQGFQDTSVQGLVWVPDALHHGYRALHENKTTFKRNPFEKLHFPLFVILLSSPNGEKEELGIQRLTSP